VFDREGKRERMRVTECVCETEREREEEKKSGDIVCMFDREGERERTRETLLAFCCFKNCIGAAHGKAMDVGTRDHRVLHTKPSDQSASKKKRTKNI